MNSTSLALQQREIPFARITRFAKHHDARRDEKTEGAAPAASSVTPQVGVSSTQRPDGICIITLDRPNSSANIFDRETLEELKTEFERIASAPQIRGVILISAKNSIFVAGADLNLMNEKASAADVEQLIALGQDVMNRLAALTIPTVAAVHGAAVGGGYEICLACDYRVASPDKATKLGLPEINLGLLPAWGGATRLPRLIGLPKALSIILGGKIVAARQALKLGMVDQLAPREYLLDVAAKLIGQGKPRRPSHKLLNNAVAASIIAKRARDAVLKKTRGHYPAPLKALEVAARGISKSIPDSLALERQGILELVQTEACLNLIRVFFLQERTKKLSVPGLSREAAVQPIKRTAVIGCGVMGAGIAQWLSARNFPVILRDLNTEQVAKGMAAIAKIYQQAVKRRVFTPLEARQAMDRISPAPSEVPLRQADIVIEAAVEKLELKKKIFGRLDEQVREDTILATNTSALPISELAAATLHPERVLGLHFFNPVHRMQLVEIVAARQTSPAVLQRALRFVQQMGKLPVLVKDSPGFLVNRILMPYLVEAGNLFEAGVSVRQLDQAMLDFGMPMGPMTLLDEVGIDVALHVAETLSANYRDRMRVPETLGKMVQAGRLGRKAGRGFLIHAKGKEPVPNPDSQRHQSRKSELSSTECQSRMVLLMINEAARCLEEQIVSGPADVDFAMIMGTGFAPFRGGPLRYADRLGIPTVVAEMERLVQSGAAHFAPCALLREMAASGKRFYQDEK
jgi:3-hydroxyacyl-CoA dehydrogenase/enoyl-CoA hydratase/3-hydroxybutyryl-CoA epimerase